MKKLLLALLLVFPLVGFSLQKGDTAPLVTLTMQYPDGTESTGPIAGSLKGSEHTLVHFFTTACNHCSHELPLITKLAKEAKGKLEVVFVAVDKDVAKVKAYIKKNAQYLTFPVAFDNEGLAKKDFAVTGVPSNFVLDHNRVVEFIHTGQLGKTELDQIDAIIGIKNGGSCDDCCGCDGGTCHPGGCNGCDCDCGCGGHCGDCDGCCDDCDGCGGCDGGTCNP